MTSLYTSLKKVGYLGVKVKVEFRDFRASENPRHGF